MTATGRAVLFHGDRRLEMAELPLVPPHPDGLTVKITRANVCGSDVHAYLGHFDMTRMGATLPTVLGHEATGTVAALGDNVTTDALGAPLAVGDRVVFAYYQPCGHCRSCMRGRPNACVKQRMAMFGSAAEPPHFVGVFADYFSVGPRATVLKAPDTVPDAVLAGANCALAQVVSGFDEVTVEQGDVVVVQGAGGLGLYATAVARDRGAAAVIVVDANADRLALARRFGATDVVDMSEVPEARDRARAVRRLTGGWGADVVVEVAGTPHAVPEGLTMVGPHGKYLIMGAVGSTEAVPIAPSRIILGNITVRGVGFYRPASLVRAVDFLTRTVDDLPYAELAGEALPLEKLGEALAAAQSQTLARPAIVV
jgi:threonine dehydrogenase-like Zn-dependent dehydrogenase